MKLARVQIFSRRTPAKVGSNLEYTQHVNFLKLMHETVRSNLEYTQHVNFLKLMHETVRGPPFAILFLVSPGSATDILTALLIGVFGVVFG